MSSTSTLPHASIFAASLINDQSYWSWPLRTPKFRPCSNLLALKPDECFKQLPPSLQGQPLAILNDFSAALDMATRSLEFYIVNLFHQHRSRTMVRQHLIHHAVGTKVLHWVFSSNVYNRIEFISNARFLSAFTFAIAAEGQEMEDLIWEWIESGYVPTEYGDINDSTTVGALRGRLPRSLIGYAPTATLGMLSN
jgi:hypothetical protein